MGVPRGPRFPFIPTNAILAVVFAFEELIPRATLELTAYELVDGMPIGKNILTNNSYINAFTVVPSGPTGP